MKNKTNMLFPRLAASSTIFMLALALTAGGCTGLRPVERHKVEDRSQAEQRKQMAGNWYGEDAIKDGAKRKYVIRRDSSGYFEFHYQLTEASGAVSDCTEVGLWGISGGIYFTLTRGWMADGKMQLANPADAYFDDAYQVLELAETRLRLRAVQGKEEYVQTRVPDGFALPPLPNK